MKSAEAEDWIRNYAWHCVRNILVSSDARAAALCNTHSLYPKNLKSQGLEQRADTALLAPTGLPIDMRITSPHSAQGQRLLLAPLKHISCNAFSKGRHKTKCPAIRAHSGQTPQPLTRRTLGHQLASLAAILPVMQLLNVQTAWGLGCVHLP